MESAQDPRHALGKTHTPGPAFILEDSTVRSVTLQMSDQAWSVRDQLDHENVDRLRVPHCEQ